MSGRCLRERCEREDKRERRGLLSQLPCAVGLLRGAVRRCARLLSGAAGSSVLRQYVILLRAVYTNLPWLTHFRLRDRDFTQLMLATQSQLVAVVNANIRQ
jgi:hypothetical protein